MMKKYFIYGEDLNSNNYKIVDSIPKEMIQADKLEKHIEQVTMHEGVWLRIWNGSRYYSANDYEVVENDTEVEVVPGYILKSKRCTETAFVPVAAVEYDEDEDEITELEIIGYISTGIIERRREK